MLGIYQNLSMNPMRTAERNDGQDSELTDPSYDLLCRPGENAQGRLLPAGMICRLRIPVLDGPGDSRRMIGIQGNENDRIRAGVKGQPFGGPV